MAGNPPEGVGGHRLVKSAGRPDAVVFFNCQVVEFFLATAELIGAPKSIAAIYGAIFASPVPIGFAEIQDQLELSTGSVSQGIRALKSIGAITLAEPSEVLNDSRPRVLERARLALARRDGKRRDFYIPNLEARKVIGSWLDERLEKQIDLGNRQLQVITEAIPKDYLDGCVAYRLEQLQNWHQRARELLPVIRNLLSVAPGQEVEPPPHSTNAL